MCSNKMYGMEYDYAVLDEMIDWKDGMNLVTTTEAAGLLGVTPQTFFKRYVKTGILKQHGFPGNNGKFYDLTVVVALRDKENNNE